MRAGLPHGEVARCGRVDAVAPTPATAGARAGPAACTWRRPCWRSPATGSPPSPPTARCSPTPTSTGPPSCSPTATRAPPAACSPSATGRPPSTTPARPPGCSTAGPAGARETAALSAARPRPAPTSGPTPLTPRAREVATLLAEAAQRRDRPRSTISTRPLVHVFQLPPSSTYSYEAPPGRPHRPAPPASTGLQPLDSPSPKRLPATHELQRFGSPRWRLMRPYTSLNSAREELLEATAGSPRAAASTSSRWRNPGDDR